MKLTSNAEHELQFTSEEEKRHRRWIVAVTAVLAIVLLVKAAIYFWASFIGPKLPYFDFDCFQLVGSMTLRGHAAAAYDPVAFHAAEVRDSHGWLEAALPWAYPPQFALVVAPLGLLPKWLAYFLFEGGALVAFLLLLRRISGNRFAEVLVAAAPLTMGSILFGQSALLIATLTGWFALATLQGRRSAGIPLGLMVIKPHLALGLGLYVLARRDWRVLGIAIAVVLASSVLATLLLGPAIWPAFLDGLTNSGRMLAADQFPRRKMISAYAALRSLDLPYNIAVAGQAAVALVAAGLVLVSVSRRLGTRIELGVATIATLGFSPYAYAYDIAIFGIGIALLWPVFAGKIAGLRPIGLLLLIIAAGNANLLVVLMRNYASYGFNLLSPATHPVIGPFAFLTLFCIMTIMTVRYRPPPSTGDKDGAMRR